MLGLKAASKTIDITDQPEFELRKSGDPDLVTTALADYTPTDEEYLRMAYETQRTHKSFEALTMTQKEFLGKRMINSRGVYFTVRCKDIPAKYRTPLEFLAFVESGKSMCLKDINGIRRKVKTSPVNSFWYLPVDQPSICK